MKKLAQIALLLLGIIVLSSCGAYYSPAAGGVGVGGGVGIGAVGF